MEDTTKINSTAYWDTRFASDWESYDGPRQSRFFARVAIDHFPHWLLEQIKLQSLTLVDWGCAQGDGTDVWASYIGSKQLVGVDFSSVAIEQAIQRYPAIRFISEDWLTESSGNVEVFDVVFSSNTLEHFHKPYDALDIISKRARKAIILVVPYREVNRIEEHFFTFRPDNIPLLLPNGFRLVWSQVVNCNQLPDTLWGGEQIVLVYADLVWIDGFGFALVDIKIAHDDTRLEVRVLSEIARLNEVVAERDRHTQELAREVGRLDALAQALAKEVGEKDRQGQELAQEVRRLDAHAQGLAREVGEKDRHGQELAREVARLSEELQRERNKTLCRRIMEKVKRQ